MKQVTELTGRVLLGHIFLLAGLNKIVGYAGTQGYMEAMGVPGAVLPLVIALEVLGGLAVIVGFQARWASIVLAGFTVIAAVIFHTDFGDKMQMIMFMKNMSITGGLLILATHGAGALSIDAKR
jgi:putative oxidoreductase